ncbi:beta-phosphoglucomutase, partial [Fusicatenibacter saccharivorans]|nr:beta-phosphoglucomutase [Fusicatenibacter saccharivorans]
RGVSRMASFDIILERYNGTMSDEEKIHWTDKKNEIYKSMLTQMGPDDMLEGVADTLHKLRAMELDLAIGS